MTQMKSNTLEAVSRTRSIARPLALRILGILGFIGLIAAGAHLKIAIGITPVPITLQTLFVVLAGALLGPAEGALAVAGYLALGAFGIPLFAKAGAGTGLAYFSGVTGGYLAGFFLAAIFVGFAVRRATKIGWQTAAFFGGSFIILAFGTLWLKVVLDVSIAKAAMMGYVPFIIGDIVKTSVAVVIYRSTRRLQR